MNRRQFLKAAGSSAASFAFSKHIFAAKKDSNENRTDRDEIIKDVDARIEKYRKGDCVLQIFAPDGRPFKNSSVVDIEQTQHKFLFGCNIFMLGRFGTDKENRAYEKYFTSLLNFATLPFYWWAYEREKGKEDNERTEEIVKFCKEKGITMKGHPLAWNWVDPKWLPDDPALAMGAQMERIERCVGRFKGKIDIWDVVNEAADYDRPGPEKSAPKLTAGIRKMGRKNYLRRAFEAARKSNPDAALLINDYRKDESFEKVITELIVDGKKLFDVIGIQSHMHGGFWGAERAWQVCEKFAKFGRPIHFTETTVLSGKEGWDLKSRSEDSKFIWESTADGEKRQAEQASIFYSILFSHPSVEAITWWDFADKGAWQQAPAGFLRRDLTPKPVYEKLYNLIKKKWWTKTQGKISEDGKVSFRGFLGRYKVTAKVENRELAGTFNLNKDLRTVKVNMR